MNLTINEMLDYTDEERRKWQEWFSVNGDECLQIPLAGEIHKNIGGLILHIFWAEFFYASWMKGNILTEEDETVKKYKALKYETGDEVFDFGEFTRREMRSFNETATPEIWDRSFEFSGSGFYLKGMARQLISHILIHEIRHWAQIAIIVREKGLAPPGDHDLIFCKKFGTTIRRD